MALRANRIAPDPVPEGLAQLLARMAAGEETALGQLYDATCGFVHGLVLRILPDAAAAEEVTLDVYHEAWHRASDFDPRRGRARGWLLSMARSRAIDRLRARSRARTVEAPLGAEALSTMDPRPDPEAQAILADRGARVRRALHDLNGEQREVIELAFFEGLSHGQVAARLRLPLGTVKTRIRLGMRKLAERLSEEDRS